MLNRYINPFSNHVGIKIESSVLMVAIYAGIRCTITRKVKCSSDAEDIITEYYYVADIKNRGCNFRTGQQQQAARLRVRVVILITLSYFACICMYVRCTYA